MRATLIEPIVHLKEKQFHTIRVKSKKVYVCVTSYERLEERIEWVEKFFRSFIQFEQVDTLQEAFLATFLYKVSYYFVDYDTFSKDINKTFEILRSSEEHVVCFEEIEGKKCFFINPSAKLRYMSTREENLETLASMQELSEKVYHSFVNNVDYLGVEDKIKVLIALTNPEIIQVKEKEIVEKALWGVTKLTRLYHENSKLRSFHQQGDFMKPLYEITKDVKTYTERGRKIFNSKIEIQLPAPSVQSDKAIEEIILDRRSRRHYSDEPVALVTLANILYYSYGVTGKLKNTNLDLRAVPSGGGLYPIDVFISIDHVAGLDKGTYYYDPLEHKLVLVNKENIGSVSNELSGYAAMLDRAAFTFILSANFWRNQWKYHERGYRVIHLDCGHVAQNLHMMATAYGLGSCCLMGFVDDELNELIKIDGVNEHSLYLITAGHKMNGRDD